MLPIFAFKLFGNPGAKLFRVSPLGQVLIHDHNANYTTGSFYDTGTFGSPYAVQFGKYIFHLTPDLLWRYDTVTGTTTAFRTPTGFTYQNHYENSGGIYLSFDGTEWYLSFIYVRADNFLSAERYRFSNRTWATSGTFGSTGNGSNPGFRYFFNNNVFWWQGNTYYKYDTLAMTAGTITGAVGSTGQYSSMCMHNNSVYLMGFDGFATFYLYQFVGGSWNIVATIATGGSVFGSQSRIFSDGTDMYAMRYQDQAGVGWRMYRIDGTTLAVTDISTTVLPAFFRTNGLGASAWKGFHVDSHTDPANPEIWLTYTAGFATAGSSLAWYRWNGPTALMTYGGDAGEGGPDYFVSYDWTGGGHYAWTPGEPYAVMEGTPVPLLGNKTRVYFRTYESNLLALDSPVEVQLHYSTDLEPPRTLATISNPELVEQTPETFSTPGDFNWTCPAGVTSVTAECFGAGGGGNVAAPNAPGGGGGGAYSRSTLSVIPGNIYPLRVGAGAAGAAGGQSYFINATTVMAMGGSPSNGASNTGQPGGQAASGFGDIKFSGGTGGNGANASHNGGGGASAHRTSNGANGGLTGNGSGGIGIFPGGSGAAGGSAAHTAPGGGAGGGGLFAGAAGQVILTYPVASQGSEVDANTIQVIAGEQRLWSLDWDHAADGVPLGARVSLAVRMIGI